MSGVVKTLESIIKGPQVPKLPALPAAPSPGSSDTQAAVQEEIDKQKKKKGYLSTILTGGQGAAQSGNIGSTTILGG